MPSEARHRVSLGVNSRQLWPPDKKVVDGGDEVLESGGIEEKMKNAGLLAILAKNAG